MSVQKLYGQAQETLQHLRLCHGAIVEAENSQLHGAATFMNATVGSNSKEVADTLETYGLVAEEFTSAYAHLGAAVMRFEAYLAGLLTEMDILPQPRTADPGPITHPAVLLGPNEKQLPSTTIFKANNAAKGMLIEVDGGMIIGEVSSSLSVGESASIDNVKVLEGKRQGKGTHLVTTFAREARLQGATKLNSFVINKPSMHTHMKVFGTSNLCVTHDTVMGAAPSDTIPPVTSSEYEEWLLERSEDGIDVLVDLTAPEVHAKLFD